MNAAELATVVEGWATVTGLMVVIAGAVFAGVQLRQEARARRLQAMMAVLSDIRPPNVTPAQQRVMSLPDGFSREELSPESRNDLLAVTASYGRLGTLLAAGMVREDDIFRLPVFSVYAIEMWEKIKHLERGQGIDGSVLGPNMPAVRIPMFVEFLASRAQAYLAREGVKQFGGLPRFDADPTLMASINSQITQARAVAT